MPMKVREKSRILVLAAAARVVICLALCPMMNIL